MFSLIYFTLTKIIVNSLQYVNLAKFGLNYANLIKIIVLNVTYVGFAQFSRNASLA
jgi:hypothetical protein